MWTPNGRRIIFGSNRSGARVNLWWQAADGTGAAERLTTSNNPQYPTGDHGGWDRRRVLRNVAHDGPAKMLRLALDGTHRVTSLLQTKFDGAERVRLA